MQPEFLPIPAFPAKFDLIVQFKKLAHVRQEIRIILEYVKGLLSFVVYDIEFDTFVAAFVPW